MKYNPASPSAGNVLRKLALYGLIGLFALYVVGVAAGYSWLHFMRKNDHVRLLDVALFQVGSIRRDIAAQHFANAQKEQAAKNFQAAYLFYSAGVRQDPTNVPGRLSAVEFLRSVGAGSLALGMLEEGLALVPEDQRLIKQTFDVLLAAGRDRHSLELLKQRYGAEFAGKNEMLLQRYELGATLAAEGAPAAKKLLDRRAGLLQDPLATPVVARVLWESAERLRAISMLQGYVLTPSAGYADFALLSGWQSASGQPADAVQTARRAVDQFPRDLSPRVLLIEMLMAETSSGAAGQEAITAYLRDFSSRPESLAELAVLSGRKGWVELNRTLYQIGANRQLDLKPLALSYCDALARESRYKQIQQVLIQLEAQSSEESPAFMVQLRQRQVITSAALSDSDSVREYTRRLVALLNRDPDGLEVCRRLFSRLGISDAVAELSSRSRTTPAPKTAAVRKQS